MPILIPTLGGDTGPSVLVTYASLSSVLVGSQDRYESLNTIDITSLAIQSASESIVVSATKRVPALSSVRIGNFELSQVSRTIDIVAGEDFTIMADVVALQLTSASLATLGHLAINARLTVGGDANGFGGTVLPIKSFNYQVPTGRLGSILNVILADPFITHIPAGVNVRFDLIVTIGGTEYVYLLMRNGKMQERESRVSYRGGVSDGPTDEVTFGATDVIADAFTLAPRRPVIMYDPARVKFDSVNTQTSDAIRDEFGRIIYPVIEPVYGLTMRQILQRAYTGNGGLMYMSYVPPTFGVIGNWASLLGNISNNQTGCGFSSIVTNIPDYPVRRADFSIENGWHDGAQPSVGMYAPMYFTEGTKLFIIDPDRVLPYGAMPHPVTLSDHKVLSERIAYKPDTNAVLLTYQYATGDPSEDPARVSRDVFSESYEYSGATSIGTDPGVNVGPGDPGFSKTTTRRWDIEYYMTDAPTNVLATYPRSVDVTTEQTIRWPVDGVMVTMGTRTTHKETTDYTYEGELLITMRKIVQGVITTGDESSLLLVDVGREDTRISWSDDPYNAGVKIQDRVSTTEYAVLFYNEETETVSTPTGDKEIKRAVPVLLAQASGIMNYGNVLDLSLQPIREIRETLHHINDRQYNVSVIETDYLTNTVRNSYSQLVTADVTTDQYGQKSRTILFRDLVSEAEIGPRIPLSINSYELPRSRAIELARRTLERLRNPMFQMPLELPTIDFAVARGSIVRGQRRNGTFTGNFFVTGYSINGQNLGRDGHRITHSLETIELLTA